MRIGFDITPDMDAQKESVMDDGKALWSMWQSLVKEFQPQLTRRVDSIRGLDDRRDPVRRRTYDHASSHVDGDGVAVASVGSLRRARGVESRDG